MLLYLHRHPLVFFEVLRQGGLSKLTLWAKKSLSKSEISHEMFLFDRLGTSEEMQLNLSCETFRLTNILRWRIRAKPLKFRVSGLGFRV